MQNGKGPLCQRPSSLPVTSVHFSQPLYVSTFLPFWQALCIFVRWQMAAADVSSACFLADRLSRHQAMPVYVATACLCYVSGQRIHSNHRGTASSILHHIKMCSTELSAMQGFQFALQLEGRGRFGTPPNKAVLHWDFNTTVASGINFAVEVLPTTDAYGRSEPVGWLALGWSIANPPQMLDSNVVLAYLTEAGDPQACPVTLCNCMHGRICCGHAMLHGSLHHHASTADCNLSCRHTQPITIAVFTLHVQACILL